MPVTGPVPWEKDPHTAAKHGIYKGYLARWFPILLSDKGYPSVTYAEGFAGPGVYKDGSPGSPVISLQTLATTPELQDSTKVTRFVFIDDDKRCTDQLRRELIKHFPQRPRPSHLMPVQIHNDTCEDAFESSLDAVGAWHQPILAVFDSWGNAPIPYLLMRRLAQNPSTEVIVTFAPQHFIRFVGQLTPKVDAVFGHRRDWREVDSIEGGDAKRMFLLNEYRTMLRDAGFQYLLDFELVTRKGESLYLIFGTNHRRGLEKMKEAVWSVDWLYGIGFRDPRDMGQQALFELTDPILEPLERLISSHLTTPGPVRVEALRNFALFSTVYREQHVIPALNNLRCKRLITCDRSRIGRASFVQATTEAISP